jgi:hypothetical protein
LSTCNQEQFSMASDEKKWAQAQDLCWRR